MKVVKKEEKQAHIDAFIRRDLATRSNDTASGGDCYLLVARSTDSPVVQALAALSDEIAAAGVTIHAIFMAIDGSVTETSLALSDHEGKFADVRITNDTRLFDAHEQLVVSDDSAWIGDILRREPSKTDAYENFCEQAPEPTGWARLAFERLWQLSNAIAKVQFCDGAMGDNGQPFSAFAATVSDQTDTGPIFGTRH